MLAEWKVPALRLRRCAPSKESSSEASVLGSFQAEAMIPVLKASARERERKRGRAES